MRCSMCGNAGVRETRQCPKNNGNPVCVANCCNNCSDYDVKGSPLCRWYINNRSEEKINPEVARMGKEIEKTKSRIRYYYAKGYTNTARKEEVKLRKQMAERRLILNETNF